MTLCSGYKTQYATHYTIQYETVFATQHPTLCGEYKTQYATQYNILCVSLSLSFSLSPSLSLSHTHTHTLSLSLSLSLSPSRSSSLTLSHAPSLSHTHTLSLSLSSSLARFLSPSSLSPTLSLACAPSLNLCSSEATPHLHSRVQVFPSRSLSSLSFTRTCTRALSLPLSAFPRQHHA